MCKADHLLKHKAQEILHSITTPWNMYQISLKALHEHRYGSWPSASDSHNKVICMCSFMQVHCSFPHKAMLCTWRSTGTSQNSRLWLCPANTLEPSKGRSSKVTGAELEPKAQGTDAWVTALQNCQAADALSTPVRRSTLSDIWFLNAKTTAHAHLQSAPLGNPWRRAAVSTTRLISRPNINLIKLHQHVLLYFHLLKPRHYITRLKGWRISKESDAGKCPSVKRVDPTKTQRGGNIPNQIIIII